MVTIDEVESNPFTLTVSVGSAGPDNPTDTLGGCNGMGMGGAGLWIAAVAFSCLRPKPRKKTKDNPGL